MLHRRHTPLSALPALAGLALLLLLPVPSLAAETGGLPPVDPLLGGGPFAERYPRPRAVWCSLPFVENLGQWDVPARFVMRSGCLAVACAERQ